MDYLKYLEMLNTILTILGNVTLEEAKSWAEVKANAEDLRREGHEQDPATSDSPSPADEG